MKHALTLIANPEKYPLSMRLVGEVQTALAMAGARGIQTTWLSPDRACDIMFEGIQDSGFGIQELIGAAPVDAILQPAENRRKKLLMTDMDSTVITIECIDELADFVGLKDKVSVITERAMNGELDFAAALTERVALLAGMKESTLQDVYDARVKFMPGARELVATMCAGGARCVLVSGGFTFFTNRVRDALGFHADHANVLEIENGVLTGRVRPPVLGKQEKLNALQAECAALGITPAEACAVGDGANDLPMLLAAGLGVAYHAKPSVQAAARHCVTYTDLRSVLWAQGFSDNG